MTRGPAMNARTPSQLLQPAAALDQISRSWDDRIVPALTEYIAIPAKSPMFAPDWEQQGHLETVLRNAADWVLAQRVAGLTLEIVRQPDRKSTRLNSSHLVISYAVFCLKN